MRSKGETFRLETNSERPWRGLKKDKLGAVIFGCKRHTIVECLKDGLFGSLLLGIHVFYILFYANVSNLNLLSCDVLLKYS